MARRSHRKPRPSHNNRLEMWLTWVAQVAMFLLWWRSVPHHTHRGIHQWIYTTSPATQIPLHPRWRPPFGSVTTGGVPALRLWRVCVQKLQAALTLGSNRPGLGPGTSEIIQSHWPSATILREVLGLIFVFFFYKCKRSGTPLAPIQGKVRKINVLFILL